MFWMNAGGVFGHSGNLIVQDYWSQEGLLGYLNSLPVRYLLKNFVGSSINTEVAHVRALPVPTNLPTEIDQCVNRIIQDRKKDPSVSHFGEDQERIDILSAEALGLGEDHLAEMKFWLDRRSPKLARAWLRTGETN